LSKKLMPASQAAAIRSRAVPRPIWPPKVTQAPNDRADNCRPEDPRRRYCMMAPCWMVRGLDDGSLRDAILRALFLRGVVRQRHWRRSMHQHTWPAGHGACGPRIERGLGKTEGRFARTTHAGHRPSGPGRAGLLSPQAARPAQHDMMDAIPFSTGLISTGTVALAEIGDKTQLLALLLAARFRKPWAIIAGILVATVLNHALAAWVGSLAAHWLRPEVLRWVVAASFIAVALWTLKPDTMDEDAPLAARGAFIATTIM